MCSSEFGTLLWHLLMPQRKTAIWVHNYSPSCAQWPQRYFGKFTSCRTFGAHKLVHFSLFWDCPCKLWQLLPALCSDMQIFFLHMYISTFLARNYCNGILLKIILLSIRCGAHKLFLPIFGVFVIFDCNVKNQNQPINHDTILVQSMSP